MAVEKGTEGTSPLEIVRRALEDAGLNPQEFAANTAGFVMDMDDENYEGGIIHVMENPGQLILYIEFRERASQETASETAEYMARANFWIAFGNFEMDYRDWSARYRLGLHYKGTELTYELMHNTLDVVRIITERYSPSLVDVMAGRKTALEAITEVAAALDAEARIR